MRIGIDVGGTSTRGVAISGVNAPIAAAERRTTPGGTGVVQCITEIVAELSEATAGYAPTEIGLGVPGLVDSQSGVVRHAANLGIAQLPLGQLVAEATGARVVVDNDVNAATLGAMQQAHPGGSELKSFVYINIGTGLRAGLVMNGQLVRGRHGHAGELGHFPLGLTERECGCGQRGCIETSTSGWALARFNADRDSDEPLPDDFLKGLVALLRMTVLTIDPSSIVLGGGVVSNSRGFLEQLTRALAEHDEPGTFLSRLGIADRVSIARTTNFGVVGAALLPRMILRPLEVPVG